MQPDATSQPKSLTLGVAHADPAARSDLEAMVRSIGHLVSLSTDSSDQLLTQCERSAPDVVLVHRRLSDGNGIDVVNQLGQRGITAAILLIESTEFEAAKMDSHNLLAGLLITPMTLDQLRPSIFIARRRFELARRLTDRARDLQGQLSDAPPMDDDQEKDS